VQADADRDPHERLRRDRRRGVGAGARAAELVLDDDHVDVLQRAERRERRHRPPVGPEQAAQRVRVVRARRAEPPVQDQGQVGRDGEEHEQLRGERPGHPGARAHERQREEQPVHRLEQQAVGHRAVGVETLQHAALDAEPEPGDPARQDRRRAPRVLGRADDVGDRLAREDRHQQRRDHGDAQATGPLAQRAGELRPMPERPQRGVARGRGLHRGAHDQQDQERRDQHGERAVVRDAEDPGEGDREDQLDGVGAERGRGQAGRLGGLGLAQLLARADAVAAGGDPQLLVGGRRARVEVQARRVEPRPEQAEVLAGLDDQVGVLAGTAPGGQGGAQPPAADLRDVVTRRPPLACQGRRAEDQDVQPLGHVRA
jgi:hypothetical protein